MKKNLLIFLVIAPAFAILLAGMQVYYTIAIWTYEGPEKEFQVRPGEGFSSINYRLHKEGIIRNSKIFYRYSQINNVLTKFKAGTFVFKPGATMLDVIEALTKGQAITIAVTIPEGKNLYEIAQELEANNITPAKEFIELAKSSRVANELGIPSNRVEGYLYPETYRFSKKTPAMTVIRTMVNEFNRQTADLDLESIPGMSAHDIVILASIVEKETGAAEERDIIAGVYYNRLKKKMRLMSDPTTIYGIYETWDGNLRKKDLRTKTPYNTYKIGGLPAGPIANPGLAAIKATLAPAQHNYLYFVSKNNGRHIFSETYKQHLAAVNKWQKTRANRKGRSWRDLDKSESAEN